jgi:chemotaxis protein histidine kinase CheA/ActR/RegA family two-component response regulator
MLDAFFAEMRNELALTAPDFARWLGVLQSAEPSSADFNDAVEGYSNQLLRIGQTAEMLGMPGLARWSEHVNHALNALGSCAPSHRDAATNYFSRWPQLVDAYFQAPADFDASIALAEYLSDSASPQPLAESESLALVEQLATPPVIPEELLADLAAADVPSIAQIEDVSLVLNDDADPDVFQAFIGEAPQNIEQFSALTLKIARGDATTEDLRNAKRIAHSFKGSANIVGIRGIASLGHHTEDILEHFEKSNTLPPRALSRALIEASDCLAQMVGHLRGEEDAPDNGFQVLSTVVAWANKVKAGEIDDEPVEVAAFVTTPIPANVNVGGKVANTAKQATGPAETEASLRVSVKTIDELFRLVSELTTKIGQMESRVKLTNKRAKDMLSQNLAMQQRVLEMEKLVVLRGLSLQRVSADDDADFDPLEMDRYNELHGATRALVEVSADAREIALVVENDIANLQSEVLQQSIVNKDLQYQITSTRMTPVSMLNTRLTRNVRQTGQQTGKDATLLIVGGEIQVDGDVLNKLADPLLHILRNAVDHGIELPAERLAAGKAEVGTINLTFARQGSTIIVTIRDDGRGFDYARIREKAIERGLIDASLAMSEQELARLTLLPGFSTRDAVSEVSGRGVGMDVVATRLAELKGSVDLASTTGQGTVVTLRFQASLVTQHALILEAANQLFAIPSHNIEQAVAAGLGEVRAADNGALTFHYRDINCSLRELAVLTGYPATIQSIDEFSAYPKVLVMVEGQTFAIAVKRVIDSRELIVKSMGRYLQRVHGVSGAALMGDGAVVPILNVKDLVVDPLAMTEAVAKMAAEARRQAKRIVVVDDSVSVRKSLIQLFEDAAFEVRAASDGLEAIRVIESFQPHAVCTDLEMPNMNGLELTQHLRQKSATKALPIMMITSRSMDKHRDQAKRAGVDAYVTKPYVDIELMNQIRGLILQADAVAIAITTAISD